MSKTREQFPLSPKKIVKKTITSTIALILVYGFITWFLLIFAFILFQKNAGMLGVVALIYVAILAVLIYLNYAYQKWYFDFYFYDLTPDYIVIRKGPITPREITIPYERIQDVYVDQDLFDRFFGLYDVHLSSATASSGMEAHIDGVEKAAADGLRAALLQTVSERISKNKTK